MYFHVITLFPEMIYQALGHSLFKKAQDKGLIHLNCVQLRDFSTDKHRSVDDTPYGGGEGMVLRADVLHRAWLSVGGDKKHTVLLSPQGERLNSTFARDLATHLEIVLVCGHYEGVDERFIELCVDQEISIGDYVLTGGELAAAVVMDAVSRFVPGMVQNADSVNKDSFEGAGGLLKHPQYTKPRSFEGLDVPEILLSGDHSKIEQWRRSQREAVTLKKRPDIKI